MKWMAMIVLPALAGCMVVKHQLTDPNVAARYDSTKSADAFAHCAADKLAHPFVLEQQGEAWTLIRKDGIRVVSRWDFFTTNAGSQAELRNGARDRAGADEVLTCA
jgi:hypothetical protein